MDTQISRSVRHGLARAPRPALLAGLLAALFAVTPALADSYDDVGRLTQAGKYAEALARADQFLGANPRDPQMRFMKGVIQINTGQRSQAIDTFNQLTRDTPELPEPYNNLAVIYAEQRDYDKARDTLERAVRARPDYPVAYENLGDVYASLARDSYSQALKRDERNGPLASKLTMVRTVFNPAAAAGAATLVSTTATRAAAPAEPASASAPTTLPAAPAAGPLTAPRPSASTAAPAPAPAATSSRVSGPVTSANAPAPAPAPSANATAATSTATPSSVPAAGPAVTPSAGKPAASMSTSAAAQNAAPSSAGNPDVEKAVRAWAAAWAGKDMTAYIAAYAPDFKPASGQAHAVWEQERRSRIEGRSRIGVEVRNLTVAVRGETATAQFQQVYSSDKVNETGRKTLELARRNGSWVIVKESAAR